MASGGAMVRQRRGFAADPEQQQRQQQQKTMMAVAAPAASDDGCDDGASSGASGSSSPRAGSRGGSPPPSAFAEVRIRPRGAPAGDDCSGKPLQLVPSAAAAAAKAEQQQQQPQPPQQPQPQQRTWPAALAAAAREALRQVLPEPAPARAYCPPSEYAVENGRVYYSDGMSADYEPTLFTKAFAALTLGVYIGVPYIILLLAALSYWSAAARAGLALVFATYFVPLRPLLWRGAMESYVFLAWRRYFNFSYVFDQSLDAFNDYVIAQFPHGAEGRADDGGGAVCRFWLRGGHSGFGGEPGV